MCPPDESNLFRHTSYRRASCRIAASRMDKPR
jgi:hypothetical protein